MIDKFNSTIIEDFEKLLELAEESSKKIDFLLQMREKQKIRSIFLISALYIFVIFTFFIVKYVFKGTDFVYFYRDSFAIAMTLILAVASVWHIYKNHFFVKKITRELRIERNIHETLISMLDDQKQHLYHAEQLSSVAFAIYEIRMQRLDRTDKNIY